MYACASVSLPITHLSLYTGTWTVTVGQSRETTHLSSLRFVKVRTAR